MHRLPCCSTPLLLLLLHPTPPPPPPLVATLHVICGQHAGLAGPLHGAVHPALVDGLSVDDDVTVTEGDLVVVLRRVVVQRPIDALQPQQQWGHVVRGDNLRFQPGGGGLKSGVSPTMVAECGGEVTDLTDDMLVWCM